MKSLLKQHQILVFFALTLIIGWFPWYTGGKGIVIAAPMLAGLIIAFLTEGKDGVLDVLRRIVQWRVNFRWYLLVLFLPVLTSLAAVVVHVLLGGTAPQFPLLKQNQHMILLTFIFYLLPWQSSAFLEEVGLRSYAQEQVQKRWGPLVGTILLGIFFGAWLLPEFLRPDSNQAAMGGIGFYPWFILTEVGWSLLMAWIYNKTGKSALVSGYLFHAAFNVWPFVLLTNAIPGEPLPAFDTTLFIINALIVLLAGIVPTIVTKGRLGHPSDIEKSFSAKAPPPMS